MILQALAQHYNTLLAQGKLARPGWDSGFKVSFGLDLNEDGSLFDLLELRVEETRGKKTVLVPRALEVPAHTGRTSIVPYFLCDNSTYLLGADAKGKDAQAVERFQATGDFHRQLLEGVNTPAAHAVCAFFDRWTPAAAASHPLLAPHWKDVASGVNLIFCYDGAPVTEDPAIRDAWQTHYDRDDPNAPVAQCLISGAVGAVAVTHPPIKGVRDAQPTGAALVSFNAPAFCSYGHEQSLNAPVSPASAFAYTSALNDLIADRNHCQVIGNTTVVCWAEHGETAYQDAWMASFFGPQEGITDDDLSTFLRKLSRGEDGDWDGVTLSPEEHFYILGLSPNAARLSVRFFLRDNFGVFIRNIRQHYEDIAIVRPSYDKFEHLPLWSLLNETVNRNAQDKSPTPQMSGDVLRAILTGTPYPATLLQGAHLRIRAEHEVTRGRAAILKGFYLRDRNPNIHKEVFTMDLNEQSSYPPYVLGRLFSVLEAVQEAANPGLNATIKDKYFNAASATPASIFPLLLNLAQKHLRKLDTGKKIYYDNQITALVSKLDATFPARLTLPEQGAFQIGYYHQNNRRYTKKEEQ